MVEDQSDLNTCIKSLLYTDNDLAVTPIMDNPKVKRPSGQLNRSCLRALFSMSMNMSVNMNI